MSYYLDKTVLTFDCYGTLIDWETGIWNVLGPVLARHNQPMGIEEALELFAVMETRVEAGPYMPYREVLATVLRRIGAHLGFQPNNNDVSAFAASVGDWPAFPDSTDALVSLKKRFRLTVITNCDDELFALSSKKLKVEFDFIITAQQARSYKPSLDIFRMGLNRLAVPKHEILHVAQSLFHDHVPAKQLGFTTVWINRRHNRQGFGAVPPAHVKPDYEFHDLRSFAIAAEL